MKTKSITKITLLSVVIMSAITAITLNSCQKENVKPKVVNTSSKTSGATVLDISSNLILDEANNIAFASIKSEKGLAPNGFDTSSCVIRTYDTVNKPYTITYNYGSGCVGSDGKTRAGIAVFTYNSTDIRQVNAATSVSFQNYVINGATVNGGVNIVNNGPNSNGNQVISETANFVATYQAEADSETVDYELEWLAGENSSPAANWEFSITGSVHQGSNNGQSATMTITTPLLRNAKNPGCNYYIQGTEQIDQTGVATKYIDFGNPGGCSGLRSVTQSGVTTVVSQ